MTTKVTPSMTEILTSENDFTKAQTITETTLTSSAGVVTWDTDLYQNAKITLTENVTSFTLQNLKAGRYIALRIQQHASAAKTIIWPATFKGMTSVVMSTGVGVVDWYCFRCVDATNVELTGFRQAVGT